MVQLKKARVVSLTRIFIILIALADGVVESPDGTAKLSFAAGGLGLLAGARKIFGGCPTARL